TLQHQLCKIDRQSSEQDNPIKTPEISSRPRAFAPSRLIPPRLPCFLAPHLPHYPRPYPHITKPRHKNHNYRHPPIRLPEERDDERVNEQMNEAINTRNGEV